MTGRLELILLAGAFCLALGVVQSASAADALNDQPWKAVLEKAAIHAWDKGANSSNAGTSSTTATVGESAADVAAPISTLLPEAVFCSVLKASEAPRPSDLVAINELAPYLQAIEEEPDGLKALAALNAAESLCASHDRPDIARLIEVTTALRHRGARVGQAAAQRLAERLKTQLAGEDADTIPAALKTLLETGNEDSARTVSEFAGNTPDTEVAGELNAILFACLQHSSETSRRAMTALANAAVARHPSSGGLAAWLEARGEKGMAARMRLDLVEFTEDPSTIARLWRDLADSMATDNDARRAAPFYLAAAGIVNDPEERKALREQAAAVLVQAGQEQAALDLCSRMTGPEVTSPVLRDFLGRVRVRAQEELPTLKARILRSPDTEVGCQALLRAFRYAPALAGEVDDLCREVLGAALESRAATLVLLAKSEQLCNEGSTADAQALLDRLPEAQMPSDLRAQWSERMGDCRMAQGKWREAEEAYRNAAQEYYYEYELGGFGFFGLKKNVPSTDLSAEDERLDAECLRGYLELAGGRTEEGISRLERLILALKALPSESDIRKLRLPDAHFLLCIAWMEERASEFGMAHGYAAIKTAARGPEQRPSLFAFAQMLAARAAAEPGGRSTSPAPYEKENLLAKAAAAVKQGDYVEARAKYKELLDSLKQPDTRIVLEACSGTLQCLVNEHQYQGFDTALAHFQAWAARTLPEGYEGCSTLAAAKVCYARNDFQGAADRVQTCLAGSDAYLVAQAHLLDGLIKFRSGRMTEALPCFEAMLASTAQDDPAGAEPLFLVGYINMVNGDSNRAEESFEALVKRYPTSNYAAKCKDLLGRLREAKAEAAAGATKEP